MVRGPGVTRVAWLCGIAALLLGACLFDVGIDDCKNYPDPDCSSDAGTDASGTGGTGGGT
jgi:hypothetical protein